MSIQSAVGNLTEAVDKLTATTNVPASTLTTKVSNIQADQATAEATQTTAEGHVTTADGHVTDAQGYLTTTKSGATYDASELAAIAASKAETAVDVFVYDTSFDSDGGAWRKRTQHTSWYNETLNTATRGSRREFPSVAVIVTTTNSVTIYDGDDPSLPMWMVFSSLDRNNGIPAVLVGGASLTPLSVKAKNGTVYWGNGSVSYGGVIEARFISDTGKITTGAGWSASYDVKANIAQRNATATNIYTAVAGPLVDKQVRAITVTVLHDAPIDPATGLPSPTIRVGTANGMSIIASDESVTTAAITTIYNESSSDDPDYDLWQRWAFGKSLLAGGSIYAYMSSSWYLALRDKNGNYIDSWAVTDRSEGAPVYQRFTQIAFDPTGAKQHLSCGMTATYCSGWMPALVKGAFLSDTDDTNLVGGSNFISGDAASDDTNSVGSWTEYDADAAVSVETTEVDEGTYSIKVVLSAQNTSAYIDIQSLNLTGGQYLKFRAKHGGGSGSFRVGLDNNNPIEYNMAPGFVTIGPSDTSWSDYFVSNLNVALGYIVVRPAGYGTPQTLYIDALVLKNGIDSDRSVIKKDLIVNGTITRTPVATGAELVGYSGFSSANYLEQPYNSDLDFGTGDFSIMGWHKSTGSNNNADIISRVTLNAATDDRHITVRRWANGRYNFGISRAGIGGDGVEYDAGNITHWAHIVCIRRSGTLELWLDGRLVVSGPTTIDCSQAGAILRVGYSTYSMIGSAALWRISATAPTANQIAKIYEDERVLFQENAACTLYGTSDGITALAHDSKTNLLHVGTNQGRSVFDGLKRIDNTTDAVGTAISVVGNLVVEE